MNIKKQKLLRFIDNNKEGFSLFYDNLKEVKKGFIVSFTHIEKTKNLNLLLDRIDFISLAFPQLKKSLVIGGWFNKDDNCFYLDLGLNIQNKKDALLIAKQFKQIAIFNLNTFEEIRV